MIVREKLDRKVAERLLKEKAISENGLNVKGVSFVTGGFCVTTAMKSKASLLSDSDSSRKLKKKSERSHAKKNDSYKNMVDATKSFGSSTSLLKEKL